ncbi:MAG: 4-phosphoerythronate dehydrogenase [Bacteroidaceae bacterium]|nr:4-phosphoerythronate dehydrogenase [Bacteroidaceae bacterium]
MKVIVDDKIPYIRGQIERLADEVVYLPGSAISKSDVRDADVLIVRTRTHCNRELLEGSSVQLIVTATIGYDHIDTAYCDAVGIQWTNCPGCNANSVCHYVHHALEATGRLNPSYTIGIVGVGHVGSLVAADLEACGMKVLLCDPPREDLEVRGERLEVRDVPSFVSLSTIQAEADIITFHTPLTKEGPYATYHMADESFFHQLPHCPLIINASRGGVVDNDAMLRALNEGLIADAVVDTWEGEPNINRELLHRVAIATPHVAGYSADGKANATRMSLEAVARFMGVDFVPEIILPDAPCLSVETLLDDSRLLKLHPDRFEEMRGSYPVRREYF